MNSANRAFLAFLVLGSAAYGAPKPPKAVPVSPQNSGSTPPKAVPVNPTEPVAPSQPPALSPSPEPEPPQTPTPQATNGKNSPTTGPVGIAARKPEDVQFELAEALTGQKQWDAAINEYQSFVDKFPASPKVGSAYFRIAEAHEKIGNVNSARLFYGKQLQSNQPGPYAGKAAYVLARFEFQEGDYQASLGHYKRAAQLLDQPEAKLSSQYFSGRCLQFLGRNLEARNVFQPLADAEQEHPYREASQFQLAMLLEEAARLADALTRFIQLGDKAQNPTVRAESATRVAILHLKLNDPKKAIPAIETALATPGTEQWHPLLKNNLFRASASLGLDQKVIEFFPELEPALDKDQRLEMLALVSEAHLRLKQYPECLVVLEKIIDADPSSTAAGKARYDKLRCFYNLESPDLPQEIDAFLASNPADGDRDNAFLMKAEYLRSKGDFANAADAYGQASKSNALKPQRKTEAQLRWAECAVRSEKTRDIIESTTLLIAGSPDHPFAATALAWRAEANRRLKALPAAEKDYKLLVDRYPKAEERHNALLQLALLRGEQNDNAGMSTLFEKLIQDYPKSAEAAQAHHWIGWAAFEAKDYKKATPHLEDARKLLPEKYQESDSLRLIFCAYYLNEPEICWGRITEYLPKGKTQIPTDILRWNAKQFAEAKKPAKSEPVWTLVCAAEDAKEGDWLALSKDRLQNIQFDKALEAIESYQKLATSPAAQSLGFVMKCRAELGKGQHDAAQKSLEEALRLQPEGRLNAEARILAGDVQSAKGQWEAAAKLYASVAVVIDDEELSPLALEKSYRAYEQAGKVKEAGDTLNRLQSRFPEYAREKLKTR